MRSRLFASMSILAVAIVAGCDQASILSTLTPPEAEASAKKYVDLLRTSAFAQIETDMDPSIRGPDLRDTLAKMAELVPAGQPASTKVVGVNVFTGPNASTTNITLEYEYPSKWLLFNVATKKEGDIVTIVGFHVNPIPDSLENLNRFTLSDKTLPQYLMLACMVVVPLFTLYVLVLCVRTRFTRRKWPWILFIICGLGKLTMNWTSGEWQLMPVAFQLFGVAVAAPSYGPWTLSVSLPVGALAFFLRRRPDAASPTLQSTGPTKTLEPTA
jgi:hypothetical protein